jgi:hypothetical protein
MFGLAIKRDSTCHLPTFIFLQIFANTMHKNWSEQSRQHCQLTLDVLTNTEAPILFEPFLTFSSGFLSLPFPEWKESIS